MVEETSLEGKKHVYSGIRATGRLHLGNYLGAIKQFVEKNIQDNNLQVCKFTIHLIIYVIIYILVYLL